MDEILTCPMCHTAVRPTDYFCFNCGKNLHPVPPSTTIEKQVMLYVGSLLLPPMGIFWGWPYIRAADTKSKTVGYITVAITVVAIILYTGWTIQFMNSFTSQMSQFQSIGGL
jgi:hypothetical protein